MVWRQYSPIRRALPYESAFIVVRQRAAVSAALCKGEGEGF